MKKIFKMYKSCNFYRYSKKWLFSEKFQKQTILNEKCEFPNCNAFWHVLNHRFKSNLNFETSSISTTSIFWAQSLTLVKSQWQRQYCWMKWQRKSWTMVKMYSKFQRNQLSHFGAPSNNKIKIEFAWNTFREMQSYPPLWIHWNHCSTKFESIKYCLKNDKNKILGV